MIGSNMFDLPAVLGVPCSAAPVTAGAGVLERDGPVSSKSMLPRSATFTGHLALRFAGVGLEGRKGMERARFKVQNTGCAGCADAIRDGLGAMPGVRHVHVDEEHGLVEVEGNALNRPAMAVKLWEIGYPEV